MEMNSPSPSPDTNPSGPRPAPDTHIRLNDPPNPSNHPTEYTQQAALIQPKSIPEPGLATVGDTLQWIFSNSLAAIFTYHAANVGAPRFVDFFIADSSSNIFAKIILFVLNALSYLLFWLYLIVGLSDSRPEKNTEQSKQEQTGKEKSNSQNLPPRCPTCSAPLTPSATPSTNAFTGTNPPPREAEEKVEVEFVPESTSTPCTSHSSVLEPGPEVVGDMPMRGRDAGEEKGEEKEYHCDTPEFMVITPGRGSPDVSSSFFPSSEPCPKPDPSTQPRPTLRTSSTAYPSSSTTTTAAEDLAKDPTKEEATPAHEQPKTINLSAADRSYTQHPINPPLLLSDANGPIVEVVGVLIPDEIAEAGLGGPIGGASAPTSAPSPAGAGAASARMNVGASDGVPGVNRVGAESSFREEPSVLAGLRRQRSIIEDRRRLRDVLERIGSSGPPIRLGTPDQNMKEEAKAEVVTDPAVPGPAAAPSYLPKTPPSEQKPLRRVSFSEDVDGERARKVLIVEKEEIGDVINESECRAAPTPTPVPKVSGPSASSATAHSQSTSTSASTRLHPHPPTQPHFNPNSSRGRGRSTPLPHLQPINPVCNRQGAGLGSGRGRVVGPRPRPGSGLRQAPFTFVPKPPTRTVIPDLGAGAEGRDEVSSAPTKLKEPQTSAGSAASPTAIPEPAPEPAPAASAPTTTVKAETVFTSEVGEARENQETAGKVEKEAEKAEKAAEKDKGKRSPGLSGSRWAPQPAPVAAHAIATIAPSSATSTTPSTPAPSVAPVSAPVAAITPAIDSLPVVKAPTTSMLVPPKDAIVTPAPTSSTPPRPAHIPSFASIVKRTKWVSVQGQEKEKEKKDMSGWSWADEPRTAVKPTPSPAERTTNAEEVKGKKVAARRVSMSAISGADTGKDTMNTKASTGSLRASRWATATATKAATSTMKEPKEKVVKLAKVRSTEPSSQLQVSEPMAGDPVTAKSAATKAKLEPNVSQSITQALTDTSPGAPELANAWVSVSRRTSKKTIKPKISVEVFVESKQVCSSSSSATTSANTKTSANTNANVKTSTSIRQLKTTRMPSLSTLNQQEATIAQLEEATRSVESSIKAMEDVVANVLGSTGGPESTAFGLLEGRKKTPGPTPSKARSVSYTGSSMHNSLIWVKNSATAVSPSRVNTLPPADRSQNEEGSNSGKLNNGKSNASQPNEEAATTSKTEVPPSPDIFQSNAFVGSSTLKAASDVSSSTSTASAPSQSSPARTLQRMFRRLFTPGRLTLPQEQAEQHVFANVEEDRLEGVEASMWNPAQAAAERGRDAGVDGKGKGREVEVEVDVGPEGRRVWKSRSVMLKKATSIDNWRARDGMMPSEE